jgi:hypothetical protein
MKGESCIICDRVTEHRLMVKSIYGFNRVPACKGECENEVKRELKQERVLVSA